MKSRIILLGLLLISAISFATIHIPEGDVSGVWTYANSPYIIDGEINIPIDSTLTIEPDVQVEFSGHYKFYVYGRILAVGTAVDTIVITAQDTTIGWHGLRFHDTNTNGQDSSKIVYCKLKYGKATGDGNEKYGGAIYCNNSSDILIKSCLITKNTAYSHGGGIFCSYSNPSLTNVTISGNNASGGWYTYGGGISCSNSSPSLENVTISGNSTDGKDAYGGGIYCSNSSPNLENVTINGNSADGYDSYGGGISCSNSSPSLENVTINGNNAFGNCGFGGGIYCFDSNPILGNVTISENHALSGGGIHCSNSSPSLENITISGNNGYDEGGGISCWYSSPSLENVTISGNTASSGGGIYCISNSNPILTNVTITGNNASPYNSKGGGIYCSDSSPSLTNVTINGNNSDLYGGGIYCSNSNLSIENVSITGNSTSQHGGGIYCSESNLSFNVENRCNIYTNNITNSRGYGMDIFAYNCDMIDVIVDTFTVFSPTGYYASPSYNFTFDILHFIQDTLINSDLYVSVDGDNSNSGTSPDEPLRTIRYAISRIYAGSLNQHTIYLLPGIYSPSTNGEQFPIPMSNYVSLQGNSQEDTFLDADSLSGLLRFDFVIESNIRNITIRNGNVGIYFSNSDPSLEDVTITGNSGGGIYCIDNSNPNLENVTITGNSGGGIRCCNNSNPNLVNVTITGNSGSWGGGIYCYHYSNPSLENVTITGNSASLFGGGICCVNSNPSLVNVTITGNSASQRGGGIYCDNNSCPNFENVTISGNSSSQHGGGIYCMYSSCPNFVNCILWNNSPQEVYFSVYGGPNTITISYSDIQDGEAGIVTNNNGTVNWLEGNIDADPLFADPQNGDFHLTWANFPIPDSTMSPCIDTGDPNSPLDPDSTRADMGAFYFDQSQQGIEDTPILSTSCLLYQNYPNPFNTSTTISFSTYLRDILQKYGGQAKNADIKIYNIKGQLVKTLIPMTNDQSASWRMTTIEWDGKDENGNQLSNGIYFYTLKVGDNVIDTKKCIILR